LDEERKRRDRAPGLAERIFGETPPVPKAVRSLVSGFVRAVLDMLGGDASAAVVSEEVAFQVWQDPRSEVLREHQGPGVARVLEARSALQSACDGLGVAVNGGAVNGGAVNGGAVNGGAVNGGAVNGGAVNGGAVNGGAVNGGGGDVGPEAHRPLTPPAASGPTVPTTPTTKDPVSSVVQSICGVGKLPMWTFARDEMAYDVPEEVSTSSSGRPSHVVVTEQGEAEAAQAAFGAKGVVANEDVSAVWIIEWVRNAMGGELGSKDCEDVGTRVALLVLSEGISDEALAAELFDLIGDAVFEHAEGLLVQRQNLRRNLRSGIEQLMKEQSEEEASQPSYGTRFTIMSESERLAVKQERKQRKRRNAKSGDNAGAGAQSHEDFLSRYGLGELVDVEVTRSEARNKIVLGNGIEFRLGEGHGKQASLPKGTVRQVYKGYEEVKVPPAKGGGLKPGEVLVDIADLPDWAQLAFEGYKCLNRIQSKIYPSAFLSNENLLVCAPTGAGKTNIAMTCILREVGQHIEDDEVVDLSEFKIVYVAPMKALAAEMTYSFGKRLEPLGLTVRELTGDMQLTKAEMEACQMIVTTPEKWDVITRKGGEVSIASKVKLLIIDEVHLLNDDRGSVIETIVARTTRQVETSQSMIRLVGLSATLPNYQDVAQFLGVNAQTGLFYFDATYRPVPLETSFVGVTEKSFFARQSVMDEVCYQKVLDSLQRGHQAMVFVHSRKDTGKSARMLAMKAQQGGDTAAFDCSNLDKYDLAAKDTKKSRNKEMLEVFASGIGIHHAGMLRSDRTMMERLFAQGYIKVLCCTATLAWGVNLPAHTVIIKGTQLYIPQKGGFTDLGMLDVQQIFGRAGRPQVCSLRPSRLRRADRSPSAPMVFFILRLIRIRMFHHPTAVPRHGRSHHPHLARQAGPLPGHDNPLGADRVKVRRGTGRSSER